MVHIINELYTTPQYHGPQVELHARARRSQQAAELPVLAYKRVRRDEARAARTTLAERRGGCWRTIKWCTFKWRTIKWGTIKWCASLKTPLILVHIIENTSNMGAHH